MTAFLTLSTREISTYSPDSMPHAVNVSTYWFKTTILSTNVIPINNTCASNCR